MCDKPVYKDDTELTIQEMEIILSSIKYLEAEFGEDEITETLKEKLMKKLSKK